MYYAIIVRFVKIFISWCIFIFYSISELILTQLSFGAVQSRELSAALELKKSLLCSNVF